MFAISVVDSFYKVLAITVTFHFSNPLLASLNVLCLHFSRFEQLLSLGKRVSSPSSNQSSADLIKERSRELTQDKVAVKEAWEKRSKQLKQCSELQLFLHDAEQVDSATSAQEAFLANDDHGVGVWFRGI